MPDTLVVGEATRRQIGGLFDLEDKRRLSRAQGLEAAQHPALGEHPPGRLRLGKPGQRLRSEVFGREEEVELLVRRWQQAKSGEGRVLLISGEPGIGKSRLTAALSEHVESEPHTRLRYFSSPHHKANFFQRIINTSESRTA
jgi:hypothetical protein